MVPVLCLEVPAGLLNVCDGEAGLLLLHRAFLRLVHVHVQRHVEELAAASQQLSDVSGIYGIKIQVQLC